MSHGTYLDCGCYIAAGGGRTWCPSCVGGERIVERRKPDQERDGDFAAAMRIVQLIVTMPEGREHTSVPCNDLRALGRVLTAQQARIVQLEGRTPTEASSPECNGICNGFINDPDCPEHGKKTQPTGRADGSND